ncbi:hypothetical protein L618_004000000270 [Rhodococcus rhodochrous J45]|uniref:Uncharacterized protein n=1 Tax=Rhodococcus rhodochrous J45 TaxID=935266 RepID=A0A562DL20_RHORH|nr:hypothetical protein L618_004000000270 [Rhodococcus rhodochrous J45]
MTSTEREVIRRNNVHDADLDLRIPARYRHDWALFADWCSAADHRPIPAAPETLALFLHEHPAAVATQRRRLSAINAVHTRHGYPARGAPRRCAGTSTPPAPSVSIGSDVS